VCPPGHRPNAHLPIFSSTDTAPEQDCGRPSAGQQVRFAQPQVDARDRTPAQAGVASGCNRLAEQHLWKPSWQPLLLLIGDRRAKAWLRRSGPRQMVPPTRPTRSGGYRAVSARCAEDEGDVRVSVGARTSKQTLDLSIADVEPEEAVAPQLFRGELGKSRCSTPSRAAAPKGCAPESNATRKQPNRTSDFRPDDRVRRAHFGPPPAPRASPFGDVAGDAGEQFEQPSGQDFYDPTGPQRLRFGHLPAPQTSTLPGCRRAIRATIRSGF
jgi:hypothetical protein